VSINTPLGSIRIPTGGATTTTVFGMKIRAEGNFTPTEVFSGYFGTQIFGISLFPLGTVSINAVATPWHITTDGSYLPLSTMPGGNSVLGILPNFLPYVLTNTQLPVAQVKASSMVTNPVGVGIHTISASQSGNGNTDNLFSLWFRNMGSGVISVNAPLVLHCTFIPSFSALSLPLPTSSPTPGITMPCTSSVSRCSSPTMMWANPNNGLPEFNQDHVFLDDRIANLLLDVANPSILNPSLKLPQYLTTYFNAALASQKEIGGVTVSAEGKLSINNTGSAGLGIGANQPQAVTNPYTAIVGGSCNGGNTLTVEKNGKLFIGSDDQQRTGHVIVQSGSTVHIQRGGNLTALGKNSSLSVQVGGTLIIDEMAEIDLQPLTSKIRIDGTLRINGNFDFFGDGYFEFGPEAKLEYGSGVQEWKLTGRGKGKRFIRLEGDLIVPDQKVLFLKDGLVEHVGITAGRIMLPAPTNPSDPTLMRRGYKGLSVTHVCLGSQSAINAEWTRDIELADCDFNAGTIGFGIAIECLNVPMLRVQQCNFKENLVDIRDNSYSSYADISLSTFTGGTWGLIMENVQKIQLAGCHFTGYKTVAHNSIDLNYEESVAAVTISNSMLCDVRDCIFQDCNVGISNPQYNTWFETLNGDGRPSILSVYGTTFARGGAGIYHLIIA
jgi:hypothetical protein